LKQKPLLYFFSFSCFQKDALKKLSEDLSRRITEIRGTNQIRDDDGERTSRVRAMEKELNSVLDENNVCLYSFSFNF
jgi:hypothetical protein